MNYQNSLLTLPVNLCIRPSRSPGNGYGIWSLADIPCKTAFGPYKGLLIDGKEETTGSYQWKMEHKGNRIIILDGGNENMTSWLRYVNYAQNKEEQNLIVVQHNLEVYYVTFKMIPASTELFVWYQDSSIYKRKVGIESQDAIETQKQCSLSQEHEDVYTVSKKNAKNLTSRKHGKNGTTKRWYECNVCGKKLSAHLKRHEMIHTGERPFKCTVCQKKFIERGALTVHERSHSAEKPYQCNECGEKFVRKSVLIIHQRVHSGEKPYECSTCGRRFRHKCYMVVHERDHTGEKPYECKVCGKKFKVKSPMIVHQRIHTGEKPFTCKICRKKFSHLTTMAEHEMTHTGNKPFQCSSCGKKFGNRYKLSTHERIHV